MHARPEEVLAFWLDEVGPDGWYRQDEALDAGIRARFLGTWEMARAGALDTWTCTPDTCLALAILLDQFPRNMFRGDARSFTSDAKALAVAKGAIQRGLDRRVGLPERDFFYLPLRHSEVLGDQEKSVRLCLLSFGHSENLRHARAHRDIIRRFGRFPFRNAALGRASTPEEEGFLAAGGYRAAMAAVGP